MKIENNLPSINRNVTERVSKSAKEDARKAYRDSGSTTAADSTMFSEEAQLFSKAMMKVIDVPDTRQAIVQNLKSQIMDGKYQIHYEKLAEILASADIFE